MKFRQYQERQKIEIFPQETYETQNFTSKTLIGLYSITKVISEIIIHLKESNGSMK